MPQDRNSDGIWRTPTCACTKCFILLCVNLLFFTASTTLLALYCPILPFAAPYDGTSGWYTTTTVAHTSNSCTDWLLLCTIFMLMASVLMCPLYCFCCMCHWTRKTPVATHNPPAIVPTPSPTGVYTIQFNQENYSLFTPRAAGNWASQDRPLGWRPSFSGLESGAPGIVSDFSRDSSSGVSRDHPSRSSDVHPTNTAHPTSTVLTDSLAGPPSYDGLSFSNMPPGYNTLYPAAEQSDDANKNVELSET